LPTTAIHSRRRKSRYLNAGLGWRHWFSPQVEIRPEISSYRSIDAPAFNGNFSTGMVRARAQRGSPLPI
jgi:hypothetical protein